MDKGTNTTTVTETNIVPPTPAEVTTTETTTVKQ